MISHCKWVIFRFHVNFLRCIDQPNSERHLLCEPSNNPKTQRIQKEMPKENLFSSSWSTTPTRNVSPPEIAGVPYDQGLWKPLVSLNKASY